MRGSQGISSPNTLTCSHTAKGCMTESAMCVKAVRCSQKVSSSSAGELKPVLGNAYNALVSTLILDIRNLHHQPFYVYHNK